MFRAAEAAGHAQTALDRAAAEAVDEAVARTEAALTDAAEAESRAAAAAAVATAHEEVSVGQTNLAEQVCSSLGGVWIYLGLLKPWQCSLLGRLLNAACLWYFLHHAEVSSF